MAKPCIEIAWLAGFCPVQAEGTIDGEPFYFRARGDRWSLRIGGDDVVGDPDWRHDECYGEGPFDAGWMDTEEAEVFIREGARLYHEAAQWTGTEWRSLNDIQEALEALQAASPKWPLMMARGQE